MFSDYSVRYAEKKDINDIANLHSLNKTRDYFLPFGLNFKWSYILIKFMFIILVFHLILNYESNRLIVFNSYLDLLINIAFFGLISYGFIKIPLRIFERYRYFGLQNYSQFILLEYGNQVIGYVRFLKKAEYSILNHVYVPERLKKELTYFLIQHVISKAVQPVYIACTKEEDKFYVNVGFQQIDIRKLPENLRFCGWLNELFGGKNLICVS